MVDQHLRVLPRVTPAGFTSRPAGWDDLDAVVALEAAVARDRGAVPAVRAEDVRVAWLGLSGLDDVVLVEHDPPDTALAAYASFEATTAPWSDAVDLHAEGGVHPAQRSRGLGSFLLSLAEDRGTAVAWDAGLGEVRLRTSLVNGGPRERAWFDARGFRAVRHLLELRLDLHAPPPAAVWPAGVRARAFRPGRDERTLWAAHQAAFAAVPTHLPLTLDDFLDDRLGGELGADPDLILLAAHGDEVVGFAVCRAGTEVAASDGWVRDLGVVPGWRRRGIGMALLRTAFAAFRRRGSTGVALEVDDVTLDGAAALYRRAGMRTVARTDVLERVLRTPRRSAPTPP